MGLNKKYIYIDGSKGNDKNDGLHRTKAKLTLQGAIDSIPFHVTEDINLKTIGGPITNFNDINFNKNIHRDATLTIDGGQSFDEFDAYDEYDEFGDIDDSGGDMPLSERLYDA